MTHTKDEALKLALEALTSHVERFDSEQFTSLCELDPAKEAITAIKQALAAQPVTKESSETQTASAYVKTYHGGKPWPLQPAPVQEEDLYDLAVKADNEGQP
jgi:hypothetical protein